MAKKSPLDEFFSAGFSLLDELFTPDSRKNPSPELGPTFRQTLRKPAKGGMADRLRQIDWCQFEKLVGAIYGENGCVVEPLGGTKPEDAVGSSSTARL